jgi:hypothetical protein
MMILDKVDKKYKLKKHKKANLRGLKLNLVDGYVILENDQTLNLTSIRIVNRDGNTVSDLGYFPSNLEPEHTGSVDYSSSVFKVSLHKLWDEQRFLDVSGYENLDVINPACCRIHLRKPPQYWKDDMVRKFKNMVDEVEKLL